MAQQLAAQQAQALQAAANVGVQPTAHRNPFWGMQGLGNTGAVNPMLNAGMQPNFFPSMQAAAMAQENNASQVATAKLGLSKDATESNSSLVVRSSVRKYNVNGTLFSVAQWTRKCLEENLEWLVKICRRKFPNEKQILLAYGDGCETLIFMDEAVNKMPTDFRRFRKIGVGVSMAEIEFKGDEAKLAKIGVLQPSDSIWDHLRYEQMDTTKDKKEKCLYIHTNTKVWSDSVDGRRRILQILTGAPGKPYVAKSYVPNPIFEQQVLAAWKMAQTTGTSAGQPFDLTPAVEGETLITFNPKELILLEKAFDDKIVVADLKVDVSTWTEEDTKRAQGTIKRAHDEFVAIVPRKRKKKAKTDAVKTQTVKDDKAEVVIETKKKAETSKPKLPKKIKAKEAKEKKAAEPKKEEKVEEEESEEEEKNEEEESSEEEEKKEEEEESEDSDDEPVSKLKEKVETMSPARVTRRSSKSATPSTDDSKRRGRPKGSKNKTKKEEKTPSKRRSSSVKKEEKASKRRKSKSKK